MNDSVHHLVFFAGVFLVVGAVVLGVGALEYEVALLGTAEEAPEGVEEFAQYDRLDDYDRQLVDRALAGERTVVRDPDRLPGDVKKRGTFAVQRDGRYYLVSRRVFFNWRTAFGAASLVLGLGGLAAISESVRRHHFPDRPVYWVRH